MYINRCADFAVAKHLLETTTVTVQEVGQRVGYLDPIFFRELFRRHTGLAPNEYRKRFGRTDRRDHGEAEMTAEAMVA